MEFFKNLDKYLISKGFVYVNFLANFFAMHCTWDIQSWYFALYDQSLKWRVWQAQRQANPCQGLFNPITVPEWQTGSRLWAWASAISFKYGFWKCLLAYCFLFASIRTSSREGTEVERHCPPTISLGTCDGGGRPLAGADWGDAWVDGRASVARGGGVICWSAAHGPCAGWPLKCEGRDCAGQELGPLHRVFANPQWRTYGFEGDGICEDLILCTIHHVKV